MKKTFEILIDSTGELNREIREKYDIDYCPMTVSISGEEDKEILASLDYDQGYSVKDFYDVMRGGKRIFTSQVRDSVFEEKFTVACEKGLDVLYISCSSALSASIRAGEKVAAKVGEKFPNRRIVCFDSLISCYGQGSMAIKASALRAEGKSLDEVVEWLTANRLRFNQFATVETLEYLKRAGRVKASKAFFGNILQLKPILISDIAGNNYAVRKAKGRKASLIDVATAAVEAAEDIENQIIYVGHADDAEAAEFCKAKILELAKPLDVYVGPLGPIIGASTGPGTIGIYCFGKEVTVKGE